MADYKVTDTQLTSIANAIRTKGGTSSPLEFPSEFVSAVNDIQNSYSQSDEGKVVSNGALVAQGSDTVTENDTYDTTLISELTVNVSGGGGGGSQLSPIYEGLSYGEISGGNFNGSATKNKYIYLFEVEANTGYCVAKPYANASHFRATFFGNATMNDFQNGIDSPSSGTLLSGTSVINYNNPYATSETYSPSSNGIIAIETSDNGTQPYAVCVALKRPS